ncbi:hypothetical protein K469DRAFT_698358 [Zopfia rhizophila CBS 207.26]|uniref:Uncharacterized protein n=1 Tax=Zopfia rhizophila CBS 207.26 TaxID=1314779 RepID=A0A6A6DDW2_9PEZI|nr:hypothetical protein K469DRAFT_698358 [Zopfia rhizophila CBS 207.26]
MQRRVLTTASNPRANAKLIAMQEDDAPNLTGCEKGYEPLKALAPDFPKPRPITCCAKQNRHDPVLALRHYCDEKINENHSEGYMYRRDGRCRCEIDGAPASEATKFSHPCHYIKTSGLISRQTWCHHANLPPGRNFDSKDANTTAQKSPNRPGMRMGRGERHAGSVWFPFKMKMSFAERSAYT